MSSIFGSNLAPICGRCLGRRSPMSDVAGESPTPLGVASMTSCLWRPGGDVRLFRLGGIIRRWRPPKGLFLFFPSFSLLFWIVSWVMVAHVDVSIRPGRVRGGLCRGPNPTRQSVGCGGSCRCPNLTGRRVVAAHRAKCKLVWLCRCPNTT